MLGPHMPPQLFRQLWTYPLGSCGMKMTTMRVSWRAVLFLAHWAGADPLPARWPSLLLWVKLELHSAAC